MGGVRARHAVVPTIGLCLLVYFAYHAVQGDRGLMARQKLDEHFASSEDMLKHLGELADF